MTSVILVSTVAAVYYLVRLVRYVATPAERRRRRTPRPYDGDPRSDTPSLWSVAIDLVDAVTGGRN